MELHYCEDMCQSFKQDSVQRIQKLDSVQIQITSKVCSNSTIAQLVLSVVAGATGSVRPSPAVVALYCPVEIFQSMLRSTNVPQIQRAVRSFQPPIVSPSENMLQWTRLNKSMRLEVKSVNDKSIHVTWHNGHMFTE